MDPKINDYLMGLAGENDEQVLRCISDQKHAETVLEAAHDFVNN